MNWKGKIKGKYKEGKANTRGRKCIGKKMEKPA
jgi:hypothetical protein